MTVAVALAEAPGRGTVPARDRLDRAQAPPSQSGRPYRHILATQNVALLPSSVQYRRSIYHTDMSSEMKKLNLLMCEQGRNMHLSYVLTKLFISAQVVLYARTLTKPSEGLFLLIL